MYFNTVDTRMGNKTQLNIFSFVNTGKSQISVSVNTLSRSIKPRRKYFMYVDITSSEKIQKTLTSFPNNSACQGGFESAVQRSILILFCSRTFLYIYHSLIGSHVVFPEKKLENEILLRTFFD